MEGDWKKTPRSSQVAPRSMLAKQSPRCACPLRTNGGPKASSVSYGAHQSAGPENSSAA